jgi:hypothetical protein
MVATIRSFTEPFSPFSFRETHFEKFLNMEEKDLVRFQAKITYIGEQRKALPTVVITCDATEAQEPKQSAADVLAMRVAGIDFANDDLHPMFCKASAAELSTLINNLSMLPTVTNAGSAVQFDGTYSGTYLSLSLFNKVDEDEARLQSIMGQIEAKPLLEAMGRALHDNENCKKALYILWRGLGFHIGTLDPDSDGDGVSDGREKSWGTDPQSADSDDAKAILAGLDPLNPFREYAPAPVLSVTEGPFRGSRIVEVTTAPDLRSGQATLELKYTPEGFLPKTDNLVFLQIFRRTAVKADGFRIPILPSLYIEYAGSPELDPLTVDGATVDHKVGELEPYYNGRDPQDKFSGAPDKQHPGFINGSIKPTAMIYRCRTYEDHWRALNPEGVREVRFDYETAVFCENGEGRGHFLGSLKWSWGKKRGEPVTAWIQSAETTRESPQAQVQIEDTDQTTSVPVFLADAPGQPSRFYFDVLASWLKHHKFAWPGREVELENGVMVVVPQPVATDTRLKIATINNVPEDKLLEQQDLRLVGFGREILGMTPAGQQLPQDYFPFVLPLTVTFKYSDQDVAGFDKGKLGIARFDPRKNRYSSEDLYVLRRNPEANSITFCASRFGKYALVGK